MKKGREVLSLPVIASSTGELCGDVREIVYDWTRARVKAVVLQDPGWFTGCKLLFWNDIISVGPDAITIADPGIIRDTKKDCEASDVYQNRTSLFGTRVVTDMGADMGTVEDTVLDEETGVITGYELSGGPVQDLLEGRRVIRLDPSMATEEHTLMVSSKEVEI